MSTYVSTLMAIALAACPTGHAYCQQVNDGISVDAADWPWWRGPARNGVANPDQDPPTEWSPSHNVLWKTAIPGRGHSSPTVVGPRIFLATADEQQDIQLVVCYDRESGKPLWQTAVHQGGSMQKNKKSSAASSTVACDGNSLFVTFANRDAVYVTSLSLDGQQRWQTKISDYLIHQGYGASPAIYQSLVIAAADSDAGGTLCGLDRSKGHIVWRRDRPKAPNYTSPIILQVAGRDQLFLTGCNLVSSFDPLTGNTLWEIPGATTECVTSTVTDGRHVYCSGGYPRNHVSAIRADASGKIAWDIGDRVYVPSLLAHQGYLYGVLDAGIAACWKSDTGEEQWKKRLGGEFSASPVLVGDLIYATNENGQTFVYRADPSKFEQIATNKLGDETLTSATICGGRVYLRVVEQLDGKRQEMLYCLAK